MDKIELVNGDCFEAIKALGDGSVDAIITDPPYDINFMGKSWDKDSLITNVDFWRECLRVLKAGGYLLAFGHSRTHHRTITAIENAGFEIRDTIMWIYGSGFPKSHNVSLAIDKKLAKVPNRGRAIPVASTHFPTGKYAEEKLTGNPVEDYDATTDEAKQWEGWGSALKPAHEPIVMARKPLEGTIADNVLKHGVGALNIDATRIGHNEDFSNVKGRSVIINSGCPEGHSEDSESFKKAKDKLQNLGRWAANVIFGHHEDCELVGEVEDTFTGDKKGSSGFATGYKSGDDYNNKTTKVPKWNCVDDCAVKELDSQSGVVKTGVWNVTDGARHFGNDGKDTGYKTKKKPKEKPSGASKFFYCPKVNNKERNKGLDAFPTKQSTGGGGLTAVGDKFGSIKAPAKNHHPTIKPIALMEYLIKLVTREGAVVLDPFMGSGSTGIAAKNLQRAFIGCEKEKEYFDIAATRIENW